MTIGEAAIFIAVCSAVPAILFTDPGPGRPAKAMGVFIAFASGWTGVLGQAALSAAGVKAYN